MAKIIDVISVVESFAPVALQESWDNCGVQVGYDLEQECRGVVLSLDVSFDAVDMAIRSRANLIITHHPLTISGVRTFTSSTIEGEVLHRAIVAGIVIYSSHTALDSCKGGLNDYLARSLGVLDCEVLVPSSVDSEVGLGRVGRLEYELTAEQLAARVKAKLNAPVVKYQDGGRLIGRVALCSGSGGSLIESAKRANVEAYICSDLKYHNFAEVAFAGITLIDVGHFESEICALDIFESVITKKFTTFVPLKCKKSTIDYI